jgi:hypothetical protein
MLGAKAYTQAWGSCCEILILVRCLEIGSVGFSRRTGERAPGQWRKDHFRIRGKAIAPAVDAATLCDEPVGLYAARAINLQIVTPLNQSLVRASLLPPELAPSLTQYPGPASHFVLKFILRSSHRDIG